MKGASHSISALLRKRGYRVTAARLEIVGVLAKSKQPLTIREISEMTNADDTSVYRTMEIFVAEDIVESIADVQGKQRYALSHGHHHHMLCTDCGLVEHVPCCGVPKPKSIPDSFKKIERHEVTYFGKCIKCA